MRTSGSRRGRSARRPAHRGDRARSHGQGPGDLPDFRRRVGVSPVERAHTLEALDAEHVNLILTSDKDTAAERYAPLRNYIEQNFHTATTFGEVIALERNQPLQ